MAGIKNRPAIYCHCQSAGGCLTSIWVRDQPLPPAHIPLRRTPHDQSAPALSIAPVQTLISVKARRDEPIVQDTIERVFKTSTPRTPNSASFDAHTILWIGPSHWWILIKEQSAKHFLQELQRAFGDKPVVVADATDSNILFNLNGEDAPVILSKLCALDVRSETIAPGRCARTRLARISATILHLQTPNDYRIIVDRSFAHYAWLMLNDAAAEFADRTSAA